MKYINNRALSNTQRDLKGGNKPTFPWSPNPELCVETNSVTLLIKKYTFKFFKLNLTKTEHSKEQKSCILSNKF